MLTLPEVGPCRTVKASSCPSADTGQNTSQNVAYLHGKQKYTIRDKRSVSQVLSNHIHTVQHKHTRYHTLFSPVDPSHTPSGLHPTRENSTRGLIHLLETIRRKHRYTNQRASETTTHTKSNDCATQRLPK